MANNNDVHISGGGKMAGGLYGSVYISGSGKLQGTVECETMHVSGACKVEDGDLTVHGEIHCSGATKVEGSLAAKSARVSGSMSAERSAAIEEALEVSGSFKCEGELRVGRLAVSGVCKTEGSISGNEISVSGVLKSSGDVQAERFSSTGALNVDGLLNAETVEIQLSGDSLVHSIGGGRVQVKKKLGSFMIFGFMRRPHLASELIEADEIMLEYTDCETVRGVNVHIGPECVIDRVEYSGNLTTDANCTIRETVKI